MKIFLLPLAFFCAVAAMADTSADIINGARKSIQVESMVETAIAKCDIQASGSGKSLISHHVKLDQKFISDL